MNYTQAQLIDIYRGLFVNLNELENCAPGVDPYNSFISYKPECLAALIGDEDQIEELIYGPVAEFYDTFVHQAQIQAGRYALNEVYYDMYAEIEKSGYSNDYAVELDHEQQQAFFQLTDEHLKIFHSANHRDDYVGIDPKRPIFGSWVELGVALALGDIEEQDSYQHIKFSAADNKRYQGFHEQMLPTMQVFFLHAQMPDES